MGVIKCQKCSNRFSINNVLKPAKYCPFCGEKLTLPLEIKEAVMTLKKFCEGHPCETCYFNGTNRKCHFMKQLVPCHWIIPED